MSENVVVNGVSYNGVDALALIRADGTVVTFYPDAVRYNEQTLTEAQKAQARENLGVGSVDEVVEEVLARLGTPVFGTVDENCKITLTGALADDKTYTFVYEDEDGVESVIGTYTKAAPPAYTNRLPLAINADGTLYNGGQGWKTNTRLNSSGAESTSSADGIEVAGFIPVKSGDKVYLENIVMNTGTKADKTYMWLYDSNFTKMDGRYRLFSQYGSAFDTQKNQGLIATDENGNITMLTIDHDVFYTGSSHADLSKAAYLRISCEEINADSIITVNEPIV